MGISLGFRRVNPVWRFHSAARNADGSPQLRVWVSPMLESNYSENRFDVSQFRLDVTRAALRTEVELRPVAYAGLLVGLDAAPAHFVSTVDVPSVLPNERLFPRPAVSDPPRFLLAEEVDGGSNAFYVQGDVTSGPLLVTAGLRAELGYYYDQTRTSLDPRAMVRLDVTRRLTLKASGGLYHQLPTPFALANVFGNPNLPLEQGLQGSVGAEVELSRAVSLDVQWFGRNTWDIAETVISPLRFLATSAPRIQATGQGRAFGAEVLLRQQLNKTPFADTFAEGSGLQWGKSFGWLAYTLLRSEERSDKPTGIPDGLATGWRSTSFDQTHIVSIAASTELPAFPIVGSFELGGAFRYVTGNPATLAQGGIYDADTSRSIRVSEPEHASRLPDFIQLDLRVDKRWRFPTWSFSAFLDLQNATNRQNFELFQYNHDFTQVQGFPGLPILPVFGAEASF